ncbi:MAG: choice-of-anchor tandem repeat GloVer-containing protein [Rhizomicrobium sp.]
MSPLFGVTLHGGTTDRGTVFELTPSSGRKKSWRESVIFTFCNDCGEAPVGVVSDASGNLFGADGDGIFELSPSNGSNWTETILHVACSETNCADGADPKGAPIFDAQGNLYGTMSSGGNVDEAGVIYKLARVGSAYQYSVLYTFCTNNDCSDCDNPQAGLVMDQSGNLFGTTFNGGPNSAGCVFEMNQSYRIVHAFGIDDSGTSPIAGVILDGSGNLFGATWSNSLYRNGAVFELKP